MFKQQLPLVSQPSSLASSILATQEKPNVVAKEIKQETSLQKALIEQSTNIEEAKSKINELEKSKKETARAKRIEKLDKVMLRPMDDAFKMTSYDNDQPIRRVLFNQHLADQGDDTEEINNLMLSSRTGGGLLSSTSSIPNPLSRVKIPKIPNPLSSISSSRITNYLDSFLDEENPQPKSKSQPSEPLSNQQQESPPTILESFEEESKEELPEEQRFGYIGGVEESKNSEPPEPEPLSNQQQEPPPAILEPVQPPPSILIPQEQMVIHGPSKVGQTSTATQQTNIRNPLDEPIPSFLRPMNNPVPPVFKKDVIGLLSKSQSEEARQARINKFDKKPLLAIEAQTTQGEAEDTIKLLENLLNPNKNASIPTFTDEEMNTYKSYTQQVKNEEQASDNTDSPELIKLKKIISDKNFTRKDLVELLAKNNITEKDGLKYRIYGKNVLLGTKSALKQNITEHILDAFNEGKITIF